MRYTIHHCKHPHPSTCIDNEAPISSGLYAAADEAYMTYTPTDYAVAAYHKGRIIGVFKYRISNNGKYLTASGTAVSKKFRGRDIGHKLWCAALRRWAPDRVFVNVISDSGMSLVRSVERLHLRTLFDITDDREFHADRA